MESRERPSRPGSPRRRLLAAAVAVVALLDLFGATASADPPLPSSAVCEGIAPEVKSCSGTIEVAPGKLRLKVLPGWIPGAGVAGRCYGQIQWEWWETVRGGGHGAGGMGCRPDEIVLDQSWERFSPVPEPGIVTFEVIGPELGGWRFELESVPI